MARTKSRELFELIKSLDKNEKRYFKVLYSGSGNKEDLKMLLLFNELNNQKEFNEDVIPEKIPAIKASQMSNIKGYLYEKILQSLRQYHLTRVPDIKIREQIDFAQLLIERRQYIHAVSCLKKAKKMARQFNNLELQLEVLRLEKELLLHSDKSHDSADDLITEVRGLNSQINNINTFSNLSVKLNSFYRRIGFIRDQTEYLKVKEFFYSNLPVIEEERLSPAEKMHLYRLYTGYYFFIQDFDNGYIYARKLEEVFDISPDLIRSHSEIFLTSLNTVLNAEFKLNKYEEFLESTRKLENAQQIIAGHLNESLKLRLQKYFYIHKINFFFLQGEFDEGIKFIRDQNDDLDQLSQILDTHSFMILNYKIACLYFGASQYRQCIRYLNKVINMQNIDVREDLHCFARILNLICHYELGNFDVIGYYIISTYRFLLKKDDLHLFQKFILTFLKNLSGQEGRELTDRFKKLKTQLVPLIQSPFEKRAFIYFDIISWLESKIEQKPVQLIIQKKLQRTN